jgi:uncharacterized membrane protein YfcA
MVQIMITCSMANQAALTWAARRNIDWRGLGVYLSGGAFGLMIGVWVLLHSDHTVYCKVLGVLLLSYGAYMLVRKPVVIRRQHAGFDLVSGFVGGITGGAGGTPGIPVTIWCSMKGWDKARQRAVFQPFILLMQTASMLAIGLARNRVASSGGFDTTDLLFVPASLLGTSIGLLFYHRLSNRQFAHALNVLLIVSGLSYVL